MAELQSVLKPKVTLLSASFLASLSPVERDESVSRSYLSELQNITLRLNEAEQRLIKAIETPPTGRLSGDISDNAVKIAEQEVGVFVVVAH